MEKREASEAGVFAGARHRFDQLLVKLPKARGITRGQGRGLQLSHGCHSGNERGGRGTRTVGSVKRRRVGRIEVMMAKKKPLAMTARETD